MYGMGGGGNWSGQWGNSNNMAQAPNNNNTRMQIQNMNQQQQNMMFKQNQVARGSGYNQTLPQQQQSLYLQQQQQQQPVQNLYNMQLQQQQPVQNLYNMQQQQQQPLQNLYLQQQQQQQQQLLLQSQIQIGAGVVPDQRMQNMQQISLGVGGYPQQTTQAQAHGANAFINPNPVQFYQQQVQPKQVNQFMQQQQAFNQQWQTPGQNLQQANNTQSGGHNPNESKNYSQGSLPPLGNVQHYGANFNTRSDFSRDSGTAAPPAPPPPVPADQPQQHNPPPPPPTQTSTSQNVNLNEHGEKMSILSTNLPGLLDIISSTSKLGKDSAVIPGLGDLGDLSSPKPSSEDTPKSKVAENVHSSTGSKPAAVTMFQAIENAQCAADEQAKKSQEPIAQKIPDVLKPSPPSVLSDIKNNISSSAATGVDILFATEESSAGGVPSSFGRSTLKAFDRKFREWEKQFEDWKKTSLNHPDKVAYGKYMGQWEAWREQLVQQRRFIIENLNKDKDKPASVNQEKEEDSNRIEHVKSPIKEYQHAESGQQSNSSLSKAALVETTSTKEVGPKNSNVEECRDLSKLIRNPFAVLGTGNSAPFVQLNANQTQNSSSFHGPAHNSFMGRNHMDGAGANNFQGPTPRFPGVNVKHSQNNNSSILTRSEILRDIDKPKGRPESPVERVSRQPRALQNDSEFFSESNSARKPSFEGNITTSSQSGTFGVRRDESISSNQQHQQRSFTSDNPFAQQQQSRGGGSGDAVISSFDTQRSKQIGESWNSFEASNTQKNIQRDENPFSQGRTNNPFCTPAMIQNPFINPFELASSGSVSQNQNQQRDQRESQFNSFKFSTAASTQGSSSFSNPERDNRFDSNRQLEMQRREVMASQYESKPVAENFTQYFRRDQRPTISENPIPGAVRRHDFEDDDDKSYAPAVIDYGHGKKEPSSLPSSLPFTRKPAQPVYDFDDDDDVTPGVTIDYGHGSKQPVAVLTSASHPGHSVIRDHVPEMYSRKEPDYDQEDYFRYAEREERNQYEQSGPPELFRREQRVAPPEFITREQAEYSKFGPRVPAHGHYTHPHSYLDDAVDPYFRPSDNLQDVRPSKPLFPIADYELRPRIAPDLHSLGGSPFPVSQSVELRQAPPRDLLLEPISPDGSPLSSRGSRDAAVKDRDRGRNRDAQEERGSRDGQDSRGRSRDALDDRVRPTRDLLDEIVRDRARSRDREVPRRGRSKSKDRARRSRSRDRVSRDRDRKQSVRSGREESPRRGRESDLSPRRSRRDESPPRRERVRRERSRSPVDLERDRRHTSSRNPPEHSARRRSPSPRRRDTVRVEEILNMPGRKKRPSQIVIFMRGLPGSGKTHVAKIIKNREVEHNESAPRIISLDDYFVTESEKTVKDPATGKDIKEKVSTYEYDPAQESKYRDDLFRTFRKTIEGGLFRFIIVDMVNDRIRHFQEMSNFATAKRFQVYVAELEGQVEECAKRNTHNRTVDQLKKLHKNWERTPANLTKLDVRTLLQDDSIQDVQMEDVSDIEDLDDIGDGKPDVEIIDPEEEDEPWATSKWETSEDKLNKLDGLARKRKSADSEDENGVQLSMEQWLQAHLPEDYSVRLEAAPGKKRVRWADIEERREQERARKYGFVVGNMNWNRLMDPTFGSSALTKTKYI